MVEVFEIGRNVLTSKNEKPANRIHPLVAFRRRFEMETANRLYNKRLLLSVRGSIFEAVPVKERIGFYIEYRESLSKLLSRIGLGKNEFIQIVFTLVEIRSNYLALNDQLYPAERTALDDELKKVFDSLYLPTEYKLALQMECHRLLIVLMSEWLSSSPED